MKVDTNYQRAVILTAILLACCLPAYSAETSPPDFRFDIRPILAKNCFACHGPDEQQRQADLRLDSRDAAVESGAIVPGSPDESEMVRRITSDDPKERMPPEETGHRLSPTEIESIKRWIAAGADVRSALVVHSAAAAELAESFAAGMVPQ